MAEPIVVFLGKNEVSHVEPMDQTKAPSRTIDVSDMPLTSDEPLYVCQKGACYALEKEGLYRFFDATTFDMRQVYLYRGDFWFFLGNISRMHVHGWRGQDQLTIERQMELAKRGRLSITCGPTANFVSKVVDPYGLKVRMVHTLTLDEWNDYDNGHTLMEAFDPNEQRWVFYDSDLGLMLYEEGRALNLGQVCRAYRDRRLPQTHYPAGRCLPDTHADAKMPDRHGFYSLMMESAFAWNDAGLHAWNARVMQVPVIDGFFPSDDQAETERVCSYAEGRYGRYPLSWQEWNQKFYR